MLSTCYVYVLLVLLELINVLNGRPQIVTPRLGYSDSSIHNESVINKKLLKRSSSKSTDLIKSNKTKEEGRILNSGNRGTISFGQFSEQDIIFPDSFEVFFEAVPRIDGPPKCADGSTFCENFDTYPYLHFREILQQKTVDKGFYFGEDEIPQVEKRIGEIEDTFLCSATSRIVFPKVGKNKDNEWKFIVNQGKDDGYVQGVRIETCRSQGGPCNIIGELPQGYRTSCKQKYVYRRLLSFNDGGTFTPDTFQLPSACCCSYTKDVQDVISRWKGAATRKKH